MMLNKVATTNKITVLCKVCHQSSPSGDVTPVESGYSRIIQSDEQPYLRRQRINRELSPLDYGWLKDKSISLLVLEHRPEGMAAGAVSDKDARKWDLEVVISLQTENATIDLMVLKPGESCQFRPAPGFSNLSAWCRRANGKQSDWTQTYLYVNVFPE